jgi:hypothetical protein
MIDVLDVLGDGDLDAHSAICITYNLDLCFYDHYMRRTLRGAGINNQLVFCDANQYQQSLEEITLAPRCGRQYSVTPARARGAFHPKVYLLLGARKGRLVVGSGNLSVGGLVRNAELFGMFEYQEDQGAPHAAFGETVAFVRGLAEKSSEAVREQFEHAVSGAPWLRRQPVSDGRTVFYSGAGRMPLLRRIETLLTGRTVKDLVVCSASFDRSLSGLRSLAGLTKTGRLTCIVQPDIARLDGASVRRLGKAVAWRSFVDPYPAEKKKRRDVRAHDKLFVFDCGAEELAVFGSANASAPALSDDDGNVEVAVVLPWAPTGTTIERLGLSESLQTRNVFGSLVEKKWEEPDKEERPRFDFDLISAVVDGNGVILSFGEPPTERQLFGLRIELAESPGRPAVLQQELRVGPHGIETGVGDAVDTARCGRVVDERGTPRSNYVALTWSEVRRLGRGGSLNDRFDRAIGAMHDGMVLGTILFEILDRFRDFEVVLAGGGRGDKNNDREESTGGADSRPTDAFYSDAIPGVDDPARWLGDRVDLDLVASLIQPLTPESSMEPEVDDEDPDDEVLVEEQERRSIDAKKGSATGEERVPAGVAPAKAIERASARLARRLARAAAAIERALEAKDRRDLKEIALPSLARQVWMAHIAAFLAGRVVTSSENQEVLCLDEAQFAKYVLRVCRALAGGKAGGLLALLPDSAWHGTDGEHVRRGLALVETCCLWAIMWVRNYWQTCEDPEIRAEGIWDSVPELIGARLLNALRGRVPAPDLDDLGRRLPLVGAAGMAKLTACRDRLLAASDALRDTDSVMPLQNAVSTEWKPGDLVLNGHVGVTFITRIDGNKVHVVDLSKGIDARRTYLGKAVSPVRDPRLAELTWRPIQAAEPEQATTRRR